MNLSIPLFSAKAANDGLDFRIPLDRVLESHWYIFGNEVEAFEHEFADYCGVSNCVSVASGSDALELGLRACGVVEGDKVFLAANAGFYGSAAVRSIGASPIYIDVDPDSLTISAEDIKTRLDVISPKAIIVTHLYGQVADINEIVELARKNKIAVIEDCAQSHGAILQGARAGSFGTIGCFSFYPTKNLGALGDGGAVVSNDTDVAARLRRLRQYGWSSKYRVDIPNGRNSRLDEMQAAILRMKLPFLDGWNKRRRRIAKTYNHAFAELPITCPAFQGEDYVAHLYVLRMENRDDFCGYLSQHEIATDIHYPVPDHLQNAYLRETNDVQLPVTEAVCKTVVSIPCFPGLTDKEIEKIISTVQNYFVMSKI